MSPHSPPSPSAPERLLSAVCPRCAATIAVDATLLGQAAECPLCDRGFRLPAPASSTPPSRPPQSQRSRRSAAGPSRSGAEMPMEAGRTDTPRPGGTTWFGPQFSQPDPIAVSGGDETAALKRTVAERAARRARRNVVMLVAGGSILLGIVMLLGGKRR